MSDRELIKQEDNLEESARYYLLNNHVSPLNDMLHQADLKAEMQYHKDIENAYKAGAYWQHGKDFDDLLQSEMKFPKEYYEKGKADAIKEMMKDAAECDVVKNGNKSDCLVWKDDTAFKRIISKLNNGDKVKIIIVKEEQQ